MKFNFLRFVQMIKKRGRLRIISQEQIELGAAAPKKRAGSKITVYGSTRPKACPVCLSDKSPSGGHNITRKNHNWKCLSCGNVWR